jgi:predicted RNA binding protein with dsRBD fold (UPF0201 family)
MDRVSVYIEAEINPTEEENKVKSALDNVIGNSKMNLVTAQRGKTLTAHAEEQVALIKFRKLLRNDRIRDAARKILFKSIRGNRISFCLNKQVAFVGHISFCEETAESALGPIKFIIETEQPQQLVEWLTEKTS